MAKVSGLEAQVATYFAGRAANGAVGLALLDKCIKRFASHGDWDALSRFVVASNASNSRSKVVKIIRAAFGNDVSFKLDKKHASGGVFAKHNWASDKYTLKNTYGVVRSAVEKETSWDDRVFLAELAKIIPDLVKAAPKVDEKAMARKVSAMKTFLTKSRSEGFNIGDIVRMAQAELAADASAAQGVVKSVVNGVNVVEINH